MTLALVGVLVLLAGGVALASAAARRLSTQLQSTRGSLRLAQAELMRAERMASIATLVRGIAHELSNPIGFIAGNMGPLQRYSEFLVQVASELSDGRARTAEDVAGLTRLPPE